ncbi:MAG TPA: MmgE/PrpD family protein [Xanthobacteraceae bacterium]|nr:MmgE/PrpD family protein [Xanthobacteraceae bacterium]
MDQVTAREGITGQLARFAASTNFDDLPADVIEGSKRSFLDTVGIILGGCGEPASQIVARYARTTGSGGRSTVIGQGFRTAPALAALINGTAADVFGFSDIVVTNMNHPSGAICAAVIALGEERRSSGKDLIAAHVIGVEVADKIGVGVKPGLQLKGWHPLAILNTFGAAVACGKLMNFDAGRMATALGIAGVMASGIRAGIGTMSKAFGAGRSARDGLEAALLAELGFTGPTDVIEARDGFLQTFGDGVSGSGIVEKLGKPFEFTEPGMTYKAYPTCTRSHPGITAVLRMRQNHRIAADAVDRVVCSVTPAVADYLKFAVAKSKLEAKYSLPFCVALALVEGEVTLTNVTDAAVADPRIIELMKKVTMVISPDFAKDGYLPDYAPHGCIVEVWTKSGDYFRDQQNRGPWEPLTPPSWSDLMVKFRGCAELVIDPASIEPTADLLHDLEKLEDVAPLTDLIREPRPAMRKAG